MGRLLVTAIVHLREPYPAAFADCVCDCGTRKRIRLSNMIAKGVPVTLSCGCMKKEVDGQCFKTHGASRTPEYNAWCLIKARCYRLSHPDRRLYGARGIQVCDRWLNSFENFLADMGKRPDRYSIERKDVNGNYCPENCCWIPMVEQAKNRRPFKRRTKAEMIQHEHS